MLHLSAIFCYIHLTLCIWNLANNWHCIVVWNSNTFWSKVYPPIMCIISWDTFCCIPLFRDIFKLYTCFSLYPPTQSGTYVVSIIKPIIIAFMQVSITKSHSNTVKGDVLLKHQNHVLIKSTKCNYLLACYTDYLNCFVKIKLKIVLADFCHINTPNIVNIASQFNSNIEFLFSTSLLELL